MPRYEPPHAPGVGSHDDPHGGSYPAPDDPYAEQVSAHLAHGGYRQQDGSRWRADDGYASPADPWQGDLGSPAGAPPGGPAPGPDPMWVSPGAGMPDWASDGLPPARTGVGVRRLVAVLAVVLLTCGAASVTGYLLMRDDPAPVTEGPSPGPARPSPLAPSNGTPLPQSSTDVRFVTVGQCVRNEGSTDDPKLIITPCAPRTYQVLERFDGATTGKDDARSKCAPVTGYTDWYFFDSPLDVLDYVLCLKSR